MDIEHNEWRGTPIRQGPGGRPADLIKLGSGSVLVLTAMLIRGLPGLALGAVGGGLLYASRRARHVEQRSEPSIDAVATITIDASPELLYDRWRDMSRLPEIFEHVLSVEDIGDGRSHWRVRGPVKRLQWDAEITVEEPGRRLAWRSMPGGDLDHEGEVTFRPAPGDRGTYVTVRMRYAPPGGRVGAVVAGLLGRAPRQTLREDLRRLKQLVETGEIATVVGQSADRVDTAGRAGRLAQRITEAGNILSRPTQTQEVPR